MRVLITGSSGQIGTNVALALLQRGDQVQGIDRRENNWSEKVPTRLLDLTQVSPQEVGGPEKFDLVLHLAAHAKVFELVEHPARAMENIQMAFNTLDYCRRSRTPIIFGSSREVYGDIHRHVTEEDAADFVVAESPYSASKVSTEAMIYSYAQCYKLPYLVFRFSNVYGRYDCDLERLERVVPLFIKCIAEEKPFTLFGREKVLDFTYVDDCTNGVLLGIDALVAGQVVGQIINLACGQGSTLVDLVNIVSLALGKKPKVTYEATRPGEVTRYVADINRARELLGYEPQTPFSSGLPLSIEWQKANGYL